MIEGSRITPHDFLVFFLEQFSGFLMLEPKGAKSVPLGNDSGNLGGTVRNCEIVFPCSRKTIFMVGRGIQRPKKTSGKSLRNEF